MSALVTREYELVLMLDPEIPEDRRDQIASEARGRIESGGSLKQDTAWGMRKLAYEIRQRTEADYRLFRFETAGELLGELNHNLRIADGVLRFRIFKVDPRSPAVVPPPPLSGSAGARGRRGQGPPRGGSPTGRSERRSEASAEAAPTAPSESGADQPAPEQPADESSEPADPA